MFMDKIDEPVDMSNEVHIYNIYTHKYIYTYVYTHICINIYIYIPYMSVPGPEIHVHPAAPAARTREGLPVNEIHD
jgi:hypothetical protein